MSDVLFLHLGKAGGGSITQHLKELQVPYSKCHPLPCPDKLAQSNYTLINIRDPVDRFHSNFYWKAKIICRPKEGDTRTIGNHAGNPFEHCTTAQQSIGAIILNKYREDANTLAEGLCSDDLHAVPCSPRRGFVGDDYIFISICFNL